MTLFALDVRVPDHLAAEQRVAIEKLAAVLTDDPRAELFETVGRSTDGA